MVQKKSNPSDRYRIRIKETVDHSFTDWYGKLAVQQQENGETLLTGQFIDQPALRGFLDQLWNLNFTVLSVERIENETSEEVPLKR